MKYRAAFASSDGIVINQHFGKATDFLIIDVDDDKKSAAFAEKRSHAPVCDGFSHNERQLTELSELLSDCRIVLASKIGEGAKESLRKKGIQGISAPFTIEEVLRELLYSDVKCVGDAIKEGKQE
ncbi:dinitrogenase iron-molybdenum cofactor biosynthesis protein [bacterium 210820-DFI.6.37]|nr:dinitrogenase iron-molybdenum cofactor biosynthesis protein [bacterium 210820-DFI.6.37]